MASGSDRELGTTRVNDHQALQYGVVIGLDELDVDPAILRTWADIYCTEYVFQKERSEAGHLHFQCWFKFKTRHTGLWIQHQLAAFSSNVRWMRVRKTDAIQRYVSKLDTREAGPWAKGVAIPWSDAEIENILDYTAMYEWQQELWDTLSEPVACPRRIHWVWEPEGACGKSTFARTVVFKKADAIIVGGRPGDMQYAVSTCGSAPHIVIVDVARAQKLHAGFYVGLESIKNGTFFAAKFKSNMFKSAKIPHIIVFANRRPERGNYWSHDRCREHRIVDGKLVPHLFQLSEETVDDEVIEGYEDS